MSIFSSLFSSKITASLLAVVILFSMFVSFTLLVNLNIDEVEASPFYAPTVTNELVHSNVKVVVYNGGHNPADPPYDHPAKITAIHDYIEDASRPKGYANQNAEKSIQFNVVETVVINNPPAQKGIDCAQYLPQIWAGEWTMIDWQTTNCWGSGTADYQQIITENNICTMANNNEIDEVWFIGFGYAGFYEANMAGPTAFYVNGPVVENVGCNNNIHIMGFNYQLEEHFAAHSFGHRMERIILRYIGHAELIAFSGNTAGSTANKPPGRCGNVHLPPNGEAAYEYGNPNPVETDCRYWNPQGTAPTSVITCAEWGCNQEGYMKWWLQNIPGLNNWLYDLDGEKMPNIWGYFLHDEDYDPIGADFTSDIGDTPLVGTAEVEFQDLSVGTPIEWLWNFGDGSTSTQQHPTHAYGLGYFTVTLVVTNSEGETSTKVFPDYVQVNNPGKFGRY